VCPLRIERTQIGQMRGREHRDAEIIGLAREWALRQVRETEGGIDLFRRCLLYHGWEAVHPMNGRNAQLPQPLIDAARTTASIDTPLHLRPGHRVELR
jgi:hypothetical protein